MSDTSPEANPEPNAEAKLLEGLTTPPGDAVSPGPQDSPEAPPTPQSGSKRGRKKLLYILVLIAVLILGLALARDGFHPFPVIPPTPAYP